MQVSVKLYATLREFAPPNTLLGEAFEVELNGDTIKDLLKQLGIRKEEAYIVLVNGISAYDLERKLQSKDLVVLFPAIGGGS